MVQLSLFAERPVAAPAVLGRASVRELAKSQILTKASGSMRDYDFSLNPYVGCGFACTYCFAANFVPDEERKAAWGTWVDVKANAAADLLKKRDLAGKRIFMSSATDPYQPLEAHARISRRVLEVLVEKQPSLVIQTRGPLVTRDIDLLRQLKRVRVNMSITTDDDEMRKLFEPSCASIERRLLALKEVADAGIPTTICMKPMLPMKDPRAFGRRIRDLGFTYQTAGYFAFSDLQFAARGCGDSRFG